MWWRSRWHWRIWLLLENSYWEDEMGVSAGGCALTPSVDGLTFFTPPMVAQKLRTARGQYWRSLRLELINPTHTTRCSQSLRHYFGAWMSRTFHYSSPSLLHHAQRQLKLQTTNREQLWEYLTFWGSSYEARVSSFPGAKSGPRENASCFHSNKEVSRPHGHYFMFLSPRDTFDC